MQQPGDEQRNTLQVANTFLAGAIKFVGTISRDTLCSLHKQMGMCFVKKWFSMIDDLAYNFQH